MFRGNNQSLKRCVSFPVNGDPRMCAHIFFFCFVFSTPCHRWFVLYFIKSVFRRWLTVLESYWFCFNRWSTIYPPCYICRDYFEAWSFISSRLVSLRCSTFDWIAGRGRSIQLFLNDSKLSDLNVKEKSISESVFFPRRSISSSLCSVFFNLRLKKKKKKEKSHVP